jgi:hypothetical protein
MRLPAFAKILFQKDSSSESFSDAFFVRRKGFNATLPLKLCQSKKRGFSALEIISIEIPFADSYA